ncbi:MAG: menaquinone biosynthesis protein, partial [Planctomycetes bacterium]|nr:menaquinone biosynthesis protein [Planctomycetota bacterium]
MEGRALSVRVGIVSYLNALPLLGDLEDDPRLELKRLPPSSVSRELLAGEIDLGLVPSFTLLEAPEWTWLPGLAIAAEGRVDSVFLDLAPGFARRTARERVRLALDPHSRTSQVLSAIILQETFGIEAARLDREEVDPRQALGDPRYDAVLLIGDLALREPARPGWTRIDLAQAWLDLTGRPFVFAVWGLRRDLLARESWLPQRFAQALEAGRSRLFELARDFGPFHGVDSERALEYLSERIRYRMGVREEEGLRDF